MPIDLLVPVLSLLVLVQVSGSTHNISGELKLASSDHFAGYAVAIYELERTAGPLSVRTKSAMDTFLLLRAPDGRIEQNDDSQGRDAKVVLANAEGGRWLAIVTTYGTRQVGPFSLEVSGAASVKRVPNDASVTPVMIQAFRARGVIDPEEERNKRLRLLRGQLTLSVFRSELLNLLQRAMASQASEGDQRKRFAELENAERSLQDALKALGATGSSRQVVEEALIARLAETRLSLAQVDRTLTRLVSAREAYFLARAELEAFDKTATELEGLRAKLQSNDLQSADLAAVRLRIGQMSSEIDRLTDNLSAKLLDSSFVSQLTFAPSAFSDALDWTAGYTTVNFDESAASSSMWTAYAAGSASTGESTASAGGGSAKAPGSSAKTSDTNASSKKGFGLSRLSSGLKQARVAGGASSSPPVDGREGVNPSVWLPSLFPWPPPQASSRLVLGETYLPTWDDRFKTLGDVDHALSAALSTVGYEGSSYWGVKNGFALVTPLEQTNNTGLSLDGADRWATRIREMKAFSLGEYVRALITAPPGHFRVLAFIVTDEMTAEQPERASFSTIERWSRAGHDRLPPQVRGEPYSERHRVTVLVYEFVKRNMKDEPLTSVPGRYTAAHHLESSRIAAGLK